MVKNSDFFKKKTYNLLKKSKKLQFFCHKSEIRTFHVTFALYKKKILSIGINSTKTHPNIKKLNYRAEDGEDLRDIARTHSELNCVLKLQNKINLEKFNDLIFVNVRLDKNGNVKYARPCNGCSHLLKQVGYKKVFYSGDCGNFFEF